MRVEILNRLLKPDEPVRRFCTVVAVLGGGSYRVADDLDRRFTVDGGVGEYLPGDAVEVVAMRIERLGVGPQIAKTFRE